MRVFIAYASEDRRVADEVAMALEGEDHVVFLDRERLAPSGAFHEPIRKFIAKCDRAIFLVSPDSVAAGAYALTELGLVRQRWRHPRGRVLPVLVRPTPMGSVPAYLGAVSLLAPQGNVAAEVAGWVSSSRQWGRTRRAVATLSLAIAATVAILLWRGQTNGPDLSTPEAVANGLLQSLGESNLDDAINYVAPAALALTSPELVRGQLSQLRASLSGMDEAVLLLSLAHPRVPPANVPGQGRWIRFDATGRGTGHVCVDFWLGRVDPGGWLVGGYAWRWQSDSCTALDEARTAAEVGRSFLEHVHGGEIMAAERLLSPALRSASSETYAVWFNSQRALAGGRVAEREETLAIPTVTCGQMQGDCVMAEFRTVGSNGSFTEQVLLRRDGRRPWLVELFMGFPNP